MHDLEMHSEWPERKLYAEAEMEDDISEQHRQSWPTWQSTSRMELLYDDLLGRALKCSMVQDARLDEIEVLIEISL